MRPKVPDEGARRRNRSRGSAPRETLTLEHLLVRSLGYGRRMNPRRSGYLLFSSRGTGPLTYPPGTDPSKPRKESRKNFQLTVHDVLRVPVHHCVRQIEAFDVCGCRRLNFLWEAEVATELNYLSQIVSDQQEFFIRSQEQYVLGRPRLFRDKRG